MDVINQDRVNKITKEKEKIKQKYTEKIKDIKEHYGIDFDIQYLKDDNIDNISFMNLKYKNGFENLLIIYEYSLGKIVYMKYNFTDTRVIRNINRRRMLTLLIKENKINFVIAEIKRAFDDFKQEVLELNLYIENSDKNDK